MMEQTLKFKTNINCGGCLSKVTPVLNHIKGIRQWNVDLESDNKILSVQSEGITPTKIIQKIEQVGFLAQEII